jgi:hypothetical protein
MATTSDVFISYADDTQPLAEELTKAFETRGIQAWVAFKDLQPGQNWRDELDRAVEQAQWLLILAGPDNRTAPRQEAEWQAALTSAWADSNKKMVPVVVGGSATPAFLRRWPPLMVDPAAEPGTWTRRVLDVIQSGANRPLRGLTPEEKWEREQRLTEIGKAAEELAKGLRG